MKIEPARSGKWAVSLAALDVGFDLRNNADIDIRRETIEQYAAEGICYDAPDGKRMMIHGTPQEVLDVLRGAGYQFV